VTCESRRKKNRVRKSKKASCGFHCESGSLRALNLHVTELFYLRPPWMYACVGYALRFGRRRRRQYMAKANAYVVVSYVQNKLQAHGSQTRNKAATPVDTKAFKDFLLFFFFAEGLVWFGWGSFLICILCVCVRMHTRICMFSLLCNICCAFLW
jgi:hypothetical protein